MGIGKLGTLQEKFVFLGALPVIITPVVNGEVHLLRVDDTPGRNQRAVFIGRDHHLEAAGQSPEKL